MSNNQDNRHEQNKKKLKTIGIVLLVVGGIFSIVGFVDFFSAFGNYGMPTKFWCLFIGFPLLGIGGRLTSLGYKREISNYVKNESVPVIKDASEELSPAIRNVANAIKDGLRGEKTENGIQCSCGHCNEKTDKFCSNCGKALQSTCPQCGAQIEVNDAFCGQCGTKLH